MGEKMMYDTIFARSFSRYDQKKLGYGAFLGCLLLALSFCTVFKPYLGPLPVLNMRLSMDAGLKMLSIVDSAGSLKLKANDTSSSMRIIVSAEKMKPICNTEERTEFCEMNGDIRIDGKSSTVFLAAGSLVENSTWMIRPYARKGDEEAEKRVKKWSVKLSEVDGYALPQCQQNHKVAAIIFSLGGYAGNNFHDYTDIVIPLYLTSRQFDGEVKFLITNKNSWWINKFRNVLQKLSRYELIDIDEEENVHCFTSVIIGLKRYPKELSIDPSKSPYSMKDFRQFLTSVYSLKQETAIKMRDDDNGERKPRLLILSRKTSRAFTNVNDIARMATTLGYKVVVAEANSNVARVAEIVNSCDVMMGVHGAGLTNMVFLPDNAILIQVVPLGGFAWLARTDFEEPSKDMNLRYLKYEIKTQESTLIQQYPAEHEVLANPYAIQEQGWYVFKSVYLQKQNVNLDVNRFRPTLARALELLHQ
ncbi:hypothetical protein PTKIN_Ptkin05aG0131300 [Pterospermum kingtungense]